MFSSRPILARINARAVARGMKPQSFSPTPIRRGVTNLVSPTPARRGATKLAKDNRHADPLIRQDKVQVVGFADGERVQNELPVEKAVSQPVSPPGADEQRRAVPLDRSIIPRLTPTMQKFAMPGKVAVITG